MNSEKFDLMLLTAKRKSYFTKFKKLITIVLLTPYIGNGRKKIICARS